MRSWFLSPHASLAICVRWRAACRIVAMSCASQDPRWLFCVCLPLSRGARLCRATNRRIGGQPPSLTRAGPGSSISTWISALHQHALHAFCSYDCSATLQLLHGGHDCLLRVCLCVACSSPHFVASCCIVLLEVGVANTRSPETCAQRQQQRHVHGAAAKQQATAAGAAAAQEQARAVAHQRAAARGVAAVPQRRSSWKQKLTEQSHESGKQQQQQHWQQCS